MSSKKTVIKARADYHLDLQVRELSTILNVSKSTVIRMLITNSINQIQDEEGNWVLPAKFHKQKTTGETCNKKGSRHTIEKLGGIKGVSG